MTWPLKLLTGSVVDKFMAPLLTAYQGRPECANS